jgi:hypothetical protein
MDYSHKLPISKGETHRSTRKLDAGRRGVDSGITNDRNRRRRRGTTITQPQQALAPETLGPNRQLKILRRIPPTKILDIMFFSYSFRKEARRKNMAANVYRHNPLR